MANSTITTAAQLGEATMCCYPDLDLGVVVMGNVEGYQHDQVAEALVSAWRQKK